LATFIHQSSLTTAFSSQKSNWSQGGILAAAKIVNQQPLGRSFGGRRKIIILFSGTRGPNPGQTEKDGNFKNLIFFLFYTVL
jgi:hypothetical protein